MTKNNTSHDDAEQRSSFQETAVPAFAAKPSVAQDPPSTQSTLDPFDQFHGARTPKPASTVRDAATLTLLGYMGLIPLGFGAVIVWLSPWLVSQYLAISIQQGTIAYAAIIAAYMAGKGAGAHLSNSRHDMAVNLPGMIGTLIAWLMIVPNGYFFINVSPAWRTLIVAAIFIWLYLRDVALVARGDWPGWYASLRLRLTAWVVIALVTIFARLLFWNMI